MKLTDQRAPSIEKEKEQNWARVTEKLKKTQTETKRQVTKAYKIAMKMYLLMIWKVARSMPTSFTSFHDRVKEQQTKWCSVC